ncbi:MAG TPA: hypothetical protein VM450_00870 [Thermomicrobiales bacterium]|jgi:hypothetical protein|nr:hypothetical protein [Thermomicrobiales bacterium]
MITNILPRRHRLHGGRITRFVEAAKRMIAPDDGPPPPGRRGDRNAAHAYALAVVRVEERQPRR